MLSKNLKKTLNRIISLKDFTLAMRNFEEEHECGTSYCIAGRLAHLDDYPDEFTYQHYAGFQYYEYSIHLINDDGHMWNFLFSHCWPNDLGHAKTRAKYLLDNDGQLPDGWYNSKTGKYDYTWNV